ncbi:hypothetical protein [Pelagicoccus sp. SDUM812003]|uniref:hypothetical protein n=1 Tax=Pelagicoccus sp. SDUM812003 TaxID=3041267 RepID=UPI00280DCCF9|nr:hypothetical protein [Pelagicoccus sp. SDUM812003]MDQ8205615.1 hypothetical protein [Pelagicoccus sp. SDUM812003]
MIVTRKIGSLIRGKASPFQIYAACLLGSLFGFLPGFQQAPFLIVLWSFLLLVLNANLFLAGVVTLICKLIFLATMPVLFSLGRVLLEGPTQGLFKAIVNAPVGAYSGFDYYVVAGGQLVALVVGAGFGFVASRALQAYRRKMARFSQNSEKLNAFKSKGWAKAMTWLFLGGGRGKKSYEELMAVKVGNPIRIWGAALVAILVGVLIFGYSALSEPFITSLAKSNLEQANGATVDLDSVDLKLAEGSLEVKGLAMADPQNLDTNIFESARIVADVSAADLLRKRFSIDRLVFEDAATGSRRESAGSLVGPAPKSESDFELPEFSDLESVLENADVWKERLAQVKRWMEKLGGGEEGAKERAVTWKEELNSRIQLLGHAHVKADFLTEGSPTLWIKDLEAKGVKTPYLGGMVVDMTGLNLSTHPTLLEVSPSIAIDSKDDRFDLKLDLAGLKGTGQNRVDARVSSYPVDEFAKGLKSTGEPPLSGGTMDIELTGVVGALDSDLVAEVAFKDSMARIGGKPVPLDGVSLPVNIRGPLDSPAVKLDSKALEKVLVSAGKSRLLEEASKKLGVEGESGDKPKDLLKGLLKKKLEE